jgi:hypothetical protein
MTAQNLCDEISGIVRLFFSTLFLNIDSELLRFFVKMAALETERFGRVRDVVIAPLQLGENRFALEVLYPLSQVS